MKAFEAFTLDVSLRSSLSILEKTHSEKGKQKGYKNKR